MAIQVNQPNLENMQQYLSNEKNKTSSSDGPKWWSIPAGMSSIRILPPWDPKGMVALPVFMHPIEYQGDLKYTKYKWTCVQATFGKPCKICEALAEMSAAGVDVSSYEPKRREFYMNAIVMHDPIYHAEITAGKKPEDAKGVAPGSHVLMRTPKTIYDWILSQITNPMVGDITSLTNGIDVYITKEGTGLGTKYTPTLSPNGRAPVPQEYLDKIESLYNLDEIFSTGFDDELIGKLVEYLKRSAGMIAQSMPGIVQNMAGYQTPVQPAPVQPVMPTSPMTYPTSGTAPVAPSPYVNTAPVAPSPYVAPPVGTTPVAPSHYSVPAAPGTNPASVPSYAPDDNLPFNVGATQQPVESPTVAPVAPSVPEEIMPKCFGNYDNSNVTCVVCPHEIQCSQSKK